MRGSRRPLARPVVSVPLGTAVILLASLGPPAAASSQPGPDGGNRRGSIRSLGSPNVVFSIYQGVFVDRQVIEELCMPAPENETLEDVFADALCDPLPGGIDQESSGAPLRNAGSGTIVFRGAPPGAVPVAAFLVWGLIDDAMIPAPTTQGAFVNGIPVTGNLLATGDEPCWDEYGEFRAYVADVGPLLWPGINGEYFVSGVPSDITDGSHPLQFPGGLPMAQGASLTVLYSLASLPDHAGVYLHWGADLLIDGLRVENPLSPPPPPGSTATRHTRIGGDGQSRDGELPLFPITTSLQDATASEQIRGPGSLVDPAADWVGSDGGPIPGLWDTQTTELCGSVVGDGDPAYWVDYGIHDPEAGGGPLLTAVLEDTEVGEPVGGEPPEGGGETPSSFGYDCVNVVLHILSVQ